MIRRFKNIIKAIPFILLIIDGVSLFLYKYPFWDTVNQYFLHQISGHALLTLFFMWYYAVIHKFCMYAKVSIIGLALLNIYNMCYKIFDLDNYIIYSRIIIITSLILATIYFIRNYDRKN